MHNNITIYGAGYVGLVTGVCMAEIGHNVLIVDIDREKIAALLNGVTPIFEPNLEESLQRHLAKKTIHFSSDQQQGIAHGLFQFIAVGTPSAEDGAADLTHVFDVAKNIAEHMSDYRIIVTKSTVTVGTSQRIKQLIRAELERRKVSIGFDVVSNPEFLRQGDALRDFMEPDRIIIGVDNNAPLQYMYSLYAALLTEKNRFIVMDIASAELTKYAANAYLATRISFINEISQLAECFGADIDLIRQGIGTDQRIGHHFLYAGCGFGGSCFPKDMRALRYVAENTGYYPNLLNAVEAVNKHQKEILFNKIHSYFTGRLRDKTVAIWGLAFKPNTDDMREASSRVLIEALLHSGCAVQAYDPVAGSVAEKIFGHHARFRITDTAHSALENADVLAILTEWDEFRQPDFDLIKKTLHFPAIFDGRNLYQPQSVAMHGLNYYAIGRGDRLTTMTTRESALSS